MLLDIYQLNHFLDPTVQPNNGDWVIRLRGKRCCTNWRTRDLCLNARDLVTIRRKTNTLRTCVDIRQELTNVPTLILAIIIVKARRAAQSPREFLLQNDRFVRILQLTFQAMHSIGNLKDEIFRSILKVQAVTAAQDQEYRPVIVTAGSGRDPLGKRMRSLRQSIELEYGSFLICSRCSKHRDAFSS